MLKDKTFSFLSYLYQAGIHLRHFAYDRQLLSSKKVPAVVISIGNIVAGGVGKTPLVHFLAADISRNFSTAILSRGYRSQAEHKKEPTLVIDAASPEEVGDEPLWLARKLPQVPVWVGKHRWKSAQKAIDGGAEVLILDDGFQHRKLHRDFDVVVVGKKEPHFLPHGRLRDLSERLGKASLLAVMGKENSLNEHSNQVIFERNIQGDVAGKKVAIFCAIGNPEQFVEQVKEAGAEVIAVLSKRDHAFFSAEELEQFYAKTGADFLVCTEKDAVKLPQMSAPVMAISLELKIIDGHGKWEQFIKDIQDKYSYVRRDRS